MKALFGGLFLFPAIYSNKKGIPLEPLSVNLQGKF